MKPNYLRLEIEIDGELFYHCAAELRLHLVYFPEYTEDKDTEIHTTFKKALKKFESQKMITISILSVNPNNYSQTLVSSWRYVYDSNDTYKGAKWDGGKYNLHSEDTIVYTLIEVVDRVKEMNNEAYRLYLDAVREFVPENK